MASALFNHFPQAACFGAKNGAHSMPYRVLWTWDSWLCDPFSAKSYVSEYRKLIDFMAEWDYNGLIIWGFIDQRHGGEAAAREVASYGRAKGVRILPGIGAGGYDGFVLGGEHEYNLPTFLKKRPDLGAFTRTRPDVQSSYWLCLYQEDALKWLRDGSRWLAENFEIGGVNIETNEMGEIDNCEHAATATREEPNRLTYAASFWDLSVATPVVYEEVRKIHPDAWITYATYSPMWWDRREDMRFLDRIPPECIAQWNTEMAVNTDVPPSTRNNISLIHSGGWSYHLKAAPPIWAFTQYRCFNPNLEEARAFVHNQRLMNLQGFALGNAGSAVMPDNEIAYIAYVEFARDASLTVREFSKRFIGELYGEDAEPIVLELMLKQPEVHPLIYGTWRSWADRLGGDRNGKLQVAGDREIHALVEQMDRVHAAREKAHEPGKRRLDVILQVLREYYILLRLSLDERVKRLVNGEALAEEEFNQEMAGAARIAREAGLPEEIYDYSTWLK